MRAILLPTQPQHVCDILNGLKTDEIRKSVPKNFRGDVYIYCTKGDYLIKMPDKTYRIYPKRDYRGLGYEPDFNGFKRNQKIVAKFTLNSYCEIECSSEAHNKFTKSACLTTDDFIDYCNGKMLYAWHIDNLVVFEQPMELSQFHVFCGNDGDGCPDSDCPYYEVPSYEYGEVNYDCKSMRPLTRPPQSYQFVEVEEKI